MTVQGKSISISDGLAAIDTGTSLIAAPTNIVKEIWSNVPNSIALSGEYAGMYAFRECRRLLFIAYHSQDLM